MLTDKQKKTNQQILLGAGGAVLTCFISQPSYAQTTTSPAITQMSTDATAIGTLTAAILPIAVGSIVFGGAALLFKRYIYS